MRAMHSAQRRFRAILSRDQTAVDAVELERAILYYRAIENVRGERPAQTADVVLPGGTVLNIGDADDNTAVRARIAIDAEWRRAASVPGPPTESEAAQLGRQSAAGR
ncbi:hypothetical protein U1Q18_051575 [Sarracenia purpurea var. burkii]